MLWTCHRFKHTKTDKLPTPRRVGGAGSLLRLSKQRKAEVYRTIYRKKSTHKPQFSPSRRASSRYIATWAPI